jgi:hypothetical protein
MIRALLALVVTALGAVPTHSGCPSHYHVDVDASLTIQKVALLALSRHGNKTAEALGVGHDPHVWLEGAEIARMPLAQLAELSWLPRTYAGAGQWFHRCRPTCVFMSERRDATCDARHWVCGDGRVNHNKVIAYKHVIRRADGMKRYRVPAGPAWQQLKAVMEAVNRGDGGLHPSCPEDGVFHHFWRNPPRHSSGASAHLSAQLEPKPYPPNCPVLQLVLWASTPQTVQGRLLSHLAGTKGVRVLEVRQVRWPRGRWNWAQCHAFYYAARFHEQAKGHVMVPEMLPEAATRKGDGPFTVVAVAVNCSLPAFKQKRRETVGHDLHTHEKLPKDQRYELHEERDGLKALKEHLRRKFLLDLPAADSGQKPWYALHMSLNVHEARHDWHAMFGSQNGGAGPRDRYYEWLLEARDNGTAWDGTVQPAPAAATCANQSYAFIIPEGRALRRDERAYVPIHESPGEIAELEGDQKFVPLPRSNRKATDAGEYTLDVHKQLKKEIRARQQGLEEEEGVPEVGREGGQRSQGGKGEKAKGGARGAGKSEFDSANGDVGSRHRLDWTEDEDEAPGGMAVSLTKERAAAILKAKKGLDRKNEGNKGFIRHKVVQGSHAMKTRSNELKMKPMSAEELAAVKEDVKKGLRKMKGGAAVRVVKGGKGKTNPLAGPKDSKEALKMLPKEKEVLPKEKLQRLSDSGLGWIVPRDAPSDARGVGGGETMKVRKAKGQKVHHPFRGGHGGGEAAGKAAPKKEKQVWA